MFCVKCTVVTHLLFYRCCHFVSHFGSWISLNDSWCPTCDIRGQWLHGRKVSYLFVLLMHWAVVEQADWNWSGNYFCYVFTSYPFLPLHYVICTFLLSSPPLPNWAMLHLNTDLSYRFILLMTQFQILSCHLCKYMKTTLCESDITYTEDFLLY